MSLDDVRPVRRIRRRDDARYDPDLWPYAVPAVRQLLDAGLDLPAGVTFLVGENGAGKSTIVEAVAAAAGLNPEGGSRHARHSTRVSESPLHLALQLVRSAGSARWGYFLRAETMHGLYTYLEETGSPRRPEPPLHEMSHGESFLQVLGQHFDQAGFYVLDEPEAALSFTSCLALVDQLHQLAAAGAQVLCATHSPLLTALPGCTILELDDDGLHRTTWEDLAVVSHWRTYLRDPRVYLRHVLG
ncbi:AAA family ATPase [uncultured Cellulomonas sp.]|uniref:AAA family ATPase n=1 Tax=uncultured Cellulomonas sp. TaxID=189682 RepID=UPI0026317B69|nr:AAA family ATPase [uncultured Cellulomonas sp.]